MSDVERKFHETWLGMVQPSDGLVVSVPVLVDAECMERQDPALQETLRAVTVEHHGKRSIADVRSFLSHVLGLTPDLLDEEAALPADLSLYVPEGKQSLRPTLGLRKLRKPEETTPAADSTPASRAGAEYELLLWDLPSGLPLDKPETATGPWDYPPSAKFDRLLRACRVSIGLLTNRESVRLVYAPHGESSGSITFRLDDMLTVGGRPILDALVMLLSAKRFFGVAEERQLPGLLRQSRLRQANVTNDLADQVFAAIGLLLRGFESAEEREGSRNLLAALERGEEHVYGGLLAVLLRLVFLLYAEDRGLLPVENELYERSFSLLRLFDDLQADHGAHRDTMSRRFGAWPRLVSLFRAVFLGVQHCELHLPARRGDLFDPERYPFLEGWAGQSGGAPITDEAERAAVRVPGIDDETIFRVLEKLLFLDGQRLSYRVLDVEQIGSVYEALMGYHVKRVPSAAVCVRAKKALVWIAASELREQPAARRSAWLTDEQGMEKSDVKKLDAALKTAGDDETALLQALQPVKAKAIEAVAQGRLVLQPGAERRRTSSHYTPRSLSAPIVRRTIEPLLAAMGESPSSDSLLSLKICDPAMGSGAFLVEACRFLADQVVAAWTREGKLDKVASIREDVVMHARRLVAQRCLYGVDKNPFAVSLAKLSMWLVTLAKDQPFTFVDHALRHGDSLVGLSLDQIRAFHWKPSAQLELFGKEVSKALDEALGLRQRILELAEVETAEGVREKERLLNDATHALDRARLIGDVCVGAFFAGGSDKEREAERRSRLALVGDWLKSAKHAPPEGLLRMQHALRDRIPAFHWMLELPEIFFDERPDPLDSGERNSAAWMDAFVGNPPFADKNSVSATLGEPYIRWLQAIHVDAHGNTDLSAHFFRRANELLGAHGSIGFVATNTIAQGDTRATGLQTLARMGLRIYTAISSLRWPGLASVTVSVVHLGKGRLASLATHPSLDGLPVAAINSRLRIGTERPDPFLLQCNRPLWFQGAKVYGAGFMIAHEEAEALIEGNQEHTTFVRPYIGGEEINTDPGQLFDRYVINFGQLPLGEAQKWPRLIQIVQERVRPERDLARPDTADGAHRKKYWWQFAQPRPELTEAIRPLKRCLVSSRVTKHLLFAFQPTDRVFSHALNVFVFDSATAFAVLQSRVHANWARLISSSLGNTLQYVASNCFETFPFPTPDPRRTLPILEVLGEQLHSERIRIMTRPHREQGLTDTYNQLTDRRCDDSDILALRALHHKLDQAVLTAFSSKRHPNWSDIEVPPYTAPTNEAERKAVERFEDEVIDRLFELNAERAEEERVLGHLGTKGNQKRGKRPGHGQLTLGKRPEEE